MTGQWPRRVRLVNLSGVARGGVLKRDADADARGTADCIVYREEASLLYFVEYLTSNNSYCDHEYYDYDYDEYDYYYYYYDEHEYYYYD